MSDLLRPDPPRPEHPRPRLVRDRWHNLNGEWAFAFDDDDEGVAQSWHRLPLDDLVRGPLDRTITVPFAYQTERSGIGDTTPHDVVWYARSFADPRSDGSERLLLHLGAVDHACQVWVDGTQVAAHEGGSTPITTDVTAALRGSGAHVLVVRAHDPIDDLGIPRGKQYWGPHPEGIFYAATTGIWQTVWLEPVAAAHVQTLHLTPDLASGSVEVELVVTSHAVGGSAHIRIALGGTTMVDDRVALTGTRVQRRVSVVPPPHVAAGHVADHQGVAAWTPEDPVLHDVVVALADPAGEVVDRVDSYVGMRDVQVDGGEVLLNGRPRYQRLVLDQGYFPGGGLTAASDADLRRDIELAKELGFDGARKHQKLEDPRWLHWADRLGFLVWEEMPSAYRYDAGVARRVASEWAEAVERDRDHPCIVAWVPMNESWGTPDLAGDPRQRAHLLALYHLTHALDGTRPVVSNDGWEHAVTDLCTIHDYRSAAELSSTLPTTADGLATARPADRPIYTTGHAHRGEPVLVTELGGVAVAPDAQTWGYDAVEDGDALAHAYDALMDAIAANPLLRGFCYTQLTDIAQEANGLLTFDRKPKADPSRLAAATRRPGAGGRPRSPRAARDE